MKSLKRFRSRQHRCYELSFIAMTREPDAEKFTLVHGYIHIYGVPVGHAWIETGDGRIYDTFLDRYTPCDEYVAEHGAVIERRYPRKEALKLMLDAGHRGPWHASPVGVLFTKTPPPPPDYVPPTPPPDSKAFRRPPLRPSRPR